MPIQGLTIPKHCPECGEPVAEPTQQQLDSSANELRCTNCDAVLATSSENPTTPSA